MASEKFSCGICLDLLMEPVSLPCGHSYCMKCIQNHWDVEETTRTYSCPQCRETYVRRPVLKKNILLAELVEDLMKTRPPAGPGEPAGPGDVACDVCTGRKLRATRSCLVCLVSYCQEHLQPHHQSAAFKKHRLVEPCKELQENICSAHGEVKNIFCRSDQQSICYLCTMDEHRGHDSVPAAAERAQKQKEVEESRGALQQSLREREEELKLLQQQQQDIQLSADEAVQLSEELFSQLLRLLQERSRQVEQQLRSQQQTAAAQVAELQEQLQQEVEELKRKDVQLEQLSHTQDHNHFLHSYAPLPHLHPSTHSSLTLTPPNTHFEAVTAAVKEGGDKVKEILTDTWRNISERRNKKELSLSTAERRNKEELSLSTAERHDKEELSLSTAERHNKEELSLSRGEPESRAEMITHSVIITLDRNTANKYLGLSEENRKVTVMDKDQRPFSQRYIVHPDRFTGRWQVLSRESLTGRCYWEVEWRGGVKVAVSYSSIRKDGRSAESFFGLNKESWALHCEVNSCKFFHNSIWTPVSGPRSSRLGVFLDHSAGILSFYNVFPTWTLLHRVHTSFTQPLHVGFGLHYRGSSVKIVRV